MIATAKALYEFLSGFGIPAYNADTVPDEAVPAYLTYPLTEPEWNSPGTFYITVYYRNQNSNRAAIEKADEIVAAIADGVRIPCDGGYIVLNAQSPLLQALPAEDDIRGVYINLQINAYHMPGM
jgi:hypothetical protein